MKAIFFRLVALLVGLTCVVALMSKLLNNSRDTGSLTMQPHEARIAEVYNSLASDRQSPSFVRSEQDNGCACYHMGILFPWDNQEIYKQYAHDTKKALKFIHSLELNRNYYGFLFLNNPTVETRVLDAGCGAGVAAILIHKMFNCSVDGYALGEKEIEYAKDIAAQHHSSDKLQFFQGNMAHLPIKDSLYDVIWVSESSEYVESLQDLFKEFKRVGKNNTRLVVFATCAKTVQGKDAVDNAYRVHLHEHADYLASAQQHGFKIAHQQNLRDWVVPYWDLVMVSQEQHGEKILAQAFLSGDVDYHLFCFDLKK